MTNEEFEGIGKMARNANDGNMFIGSFAAELIGESYPVSKGMWDIIFRSYTDIELGKKFVEMHPDA